MCRHKKRGLSADQPIRTVYMALLWPTEIFNVELYGDCFEWKEKKNTCSYIESSFEERNFGQFINIFLCICWFWSTLYQNDKVTVQETDTEYIEMNLLGKLTCFKTSLPFAWEVKYFQIFFWRVVCFHCLVYHFFLSKDFWMIWNVCKIFHICWICLNDKVMVLKKRLWHLHEEPNFFEEFVFIASFIILHGIIQKNCHDISTYLPSPLTLTRIHSQSSYFIIEWQLLYVFTTQFLINQSTKVIFRYVYLWTTQSTLHPKVQI